MGWKRYPLRLVAPLGAGLSRAPRRLPRCPGPLRRSVGCDREPGWAIPCLDHAAAGSLAGAQLVVAGLRVVVPPACGLGSTVDVDRLTGDVAGHVGCEKDCRAGHFVDMPGPAPSESCARRRRAARPATPATDPSVTVRSGASALTRIPWVASSSAAVLV